MTRHMLEKGGHNDSSPEKVEGEAGTEWVYICINIKFTKFGVVYILLPGNIYRSH